MMVLFHAVQLPVDVKLVKAGKPLEAKLLGVDDGMVFFCHM